MATHRYWIGATTAWSSTANWSLTSGGATGAPVPNSTNEVVLDAGGNFPCTTDVVANCLTFLVTSDYTATLTMTNGLTVAGNVTLGASMNILGPGVLTINTTATLRSNGRIWSGGLGLVNTITITFFDDWTIEGNLTTTLTAVQIVNTLNGSILNLRAGISHLTRVHIVGTTILNFTGTGSWIGGAGNDAGVSCHIRVNTTGVLTLTSSVRLSGGSFTHIAGRVITTGSFVHVAGHYIFTCGSIIFNNLEVYGSWTITLNENLHAGFLLLGTIGHPIINGNTLFCTGIHCQGNINVTGTTLFVLNGTGSLTHNGVAGFLHNNLTIDTTGIVSVGTFRYSSGTINCIRGSVISIPNTT